MASRRSYPAAFKLSVVRELTEGASPPSVRSLAQHHGVTPSMVRNRREGGKGITDREMQEQAKLIAEEQGVRDFHASNGYIYGFKSRNKLSAAASSAGGKKRQKGGEGMATGERDCMFGIDIGLKNVKCALVCAASGNILATTSAPIQHDANLLESEQSVANVLLAVLSAVQALPTPLRQSIRSIGICGVMHGIVWWHCNGVRRAMCDLLSVKGGTTTASARSWPWTLLTEWRAKIQLANTATSTAPFGLEAVDVCSSSSPIASGYGLATFAYMLERQPRDIVGFDACGTIQDFIAFALCGHSTPAQNCMDVTDAFSWGGFDINTKTWNPRTVIVRCQAWSRQLAVGPTTEHLADDPMYARLISLGGTKLDTDLKFSPTLYGEWASPEVRGSIEQLRISNWSLGDISAAICRGLVDNIFSMVPEDLRADLLQQPRKLAHPSQLSIQSTADAAVGVAFIPSLLQK
uniref:HTH CENPB-type domain-containing protein n=1 Tax=Phytophthora ramorum TaxID=164328 RepID=H3HEF7_PHYRM